MKKLSYILCFILLLPAHGLFSQNTLVMNTTEEIKKPASSSNNLVVFEFRTSQYNNQLTDINYSQIEKHILGEMISKKFYLFESKYTYEVSPVPGNPQSKTVIRKPVIYNAVLKIDKHLKKQLKKGDITNDNAEFVMDKVLETALCVLTIDTEEFEKSISKTSNSEALSNLFVYQVKLVM